MFLFLLVVCSLIIASDGSPTDEEFQQLLQRVNQQDAKIAELECRQQSGMKTCPRQVYLMLP